jgi:hypothetical protein
MMLALWDTLYLIFPLIYAGHLGAEFETAQALP